MSAYFDPVTAFVLVVGSAALLVCLTLLIVGATIAAAIREGRQDLTVEQSQEWLDRANERALSNIEAKAK